MAARDKEKATLLDFQLDFLREEVARTQSRIAHYDDLIFKIKGWSITLWVGAFGFGISQELSALLLAGCPVLICFWLVEATFKKYQYRHIMRMRYLEDFLDGTAYDECSPLSQAVQRGDVAPFLLSDPICRVACAQDPKFKRRFDEQVNFWHCFWSASVRPLYLLLSLLSILGGIGMLMWGGGTS